MLTRRGILLGAFTVRRSRDTPVLGWKSRCFQHIPDSGNFRRNPSTQGN
ncbi:hypothetical protein QUA75_16665 [Microcoleus sp. M2_C6]